MNIKNLLIIAVLSVWMFVFTMASALLYGFAVDRAALMSGVAAVLVALTLVWFTVNLWRHRG